MCRKSPCIIYVYKKIRTTRKSELYKQLQDSPLTTRELAFIGNIIDGLSIAELSENFHLSPSRISEWKREVCEKIQAFDAATVMR